MGEERAHALVGRSGDNLQDSALSFYHHHGPRGSNPGCQSWQQAPLTTGGSCWPSNMYLFWQSEITYVHTGACGAHMIHICCCQLELNELVLIGPEKTGEKEQSNG